MNKGNRKRLKIDRETLRLLTDAEAARAAGGRIATAPTTCGSTVTSSHNQGDCIPTNPSAPTQCIADSDCGGP